VTGVRTCALPITHADVGYDLVIIGRRATLTRPYAKLMGDLLQALDKMGVARDNPGKPSEQV